MKRYIPYRSIKLGSHRNVFTRLLIMCFRFPFLAIPLRFLYKVQTCNGSNSPLVPLVSTPSLYPHPNPHSHSHPTPTYTPLPQCHPQSSSSPPRTTSPFSPVSPFPIPVSKPISYPTSLLAPFPLGIPTPSCPSLKHPRVPCPSSTTFPPQQLEFAPQPTGL